MVRNYCKMCCTLIPEDIEKIERIAETVSIFGSILNIDVFIDCPTKDKDKAIIVYHAKPKNNSLYSKNIAGEIADVSKEPAVFRSFLTGLPSKNYKAVTQEGVDVYQNIVPVFNSGKEVIATIILEYTEEDGLNFNSDLFNFTATKLIKDIDVSRTQIPEFVKDGIVVFNKNGIVKYVNKVASGIYSSLGFSKNLVGEDFQNIVLTKTTMEEALSHRENQNIEINISDMVLLVSYFTTVLSDDEINVVMVIRDITKEKNNEQEIILKSFVIKEIHHRVKNNLQTIASLLRIQKRRVDNPEVKKILDETINRILSIAITHEVLSQNGMDSLDIKTIIQLMYKNSFKNAIDKMKKIEFNITGDSFVISSDKATAVALVINELVQNAINYAFIGKNEGKIQVIIEKKTFYTKISVVDNGVGMDDSKVRENSLGLMIVKKIVSDKLNGSFNLKSELGLGTRVEFEVKNN